MNLEIQKPELVQRVNAHIQTGQFHSTEELIEKALDALDEQAPPSRAHRAAGRKSLSQLFAESPFQGLDIDFERDPDHGRDVTR